jgi:hypothetical protein
MRAMAIDPTLLEDFGQIAEIAATMAGFAAVAGVIEHASRGAISQRLRNSSVASLLATTVTCLILALLPTWRQRVFETEPAVWRTCFGIFVASQMFTFTLFFLTADLRPMPADVPRHFRILLTVMGIVFLLIGVSLTIVGAFSVFGYLESHWGVLYHAALLFLLVNSGGNFVALLYANSGRWDSNAT